MSTMLVAGWMRGSHYGAFYPCAVEDSDPTYFDGPPRICCIGFQLNEGRFQGLEPMDSVAGEHVPLDFFAGQVWDEVRTEAVKACKMMRGHGPFMPAILSPDEMEYTTRPAVLKQLMPRFQDL
jgi:fructose 1,6-bisphosphate aldolase/phosphatase